MDDLETPRSTIEGGWTHPTMAVYDTTELLMKNRVRRQCFLCYAALAFIVGFSLTYMWYVS